MLYRNLRKPATLVPLLCISRVLSALAAEPDLEPIPIHLQVETGTPLRLYATKRIWYRKGDPVQAKTAEATWAFDRIVIPADTTVDGRVVEVEPVPKMLRAMSIVRGDFTPLKKARVSFTGLILTDGRVMPLDTEPSFEPCQHLCACATTEGEQETKESCRKSE